MSHESSQISRLSPQNAADCLALSIAVGWTTHDLRSWTERLTQSGEGSFGIFVDGQLVASLTSIAYGNELAWVGMVITHPEHQRRGYSTHLMKHALEHLKGVKWIMLDATVYGQPVYERVGFRPVYRTEVWDRLPASPPPLADGILPMSPADIPAFAVLDGHIFGAERERLLAGLLKNYPDLAWVSKHGTDVQGYVMGSRFAIVGKESAHIGPWYHADEQVADALFSHAVATLSHLPIQLNIPEQNEAAKRIATRYGFQFQRNSTRMIYGEIEPPLHMSEQYSVASLGTG